MKVLLVQSYLGAGAEVPVYPLGLAYIGTAAEARGHAVRIADLNVLPDPLAGLQRTIRDFRPDCIGFSLRNIDNQSRVAPRDYHRTFRQTVQAAAVAAGDVPFIAGGAGFSMFPEAILRRNPRLDIGVHLEAEESFPALLESLGDPSMVKGIFHRRDGQILHTGDRPYPDFAALPFPRRDFLDLAPYLAIPFSMGIQTKRGCPLRCAYCNYPHLNGASYRARDPVRVVDEIEHLVACFGVREVTFTDSVLNLPPGHSEKIFHEILRRNLRIDWGAYLHLRGISRDYVSLAIRSGCASVVFSPDGISQPVLDELCKDLSAEEVSGVIEMFRRDRAFGSLHVCFCFFISPPGETIAGLLRTLWFYLVLLTARLRSGTARICAYVSWIRLEPQTRVYEIALAEGSLRPKDNLLQDDEEDLRHMFYRHPRLHRFDRPILFALRLLQLVEASIKRVLGRRKPS